MVLLGDKGVAAVGIVGTGVPAGGAADDYGDGMQCPDHPYRPNAGAAGGGGVCAFCLQEKLGKLVSSSSSKYSFSPLPSSLFYDKDGQEGSSSESPRSVASSRYSSASAANGAGDGGKGKKGGSSYSYSLFGGRRRRHGGKENGGREESKHGFGAAKHSGSSKILMIPFFHASSSSNGHHSSKTAQKPTNPPTVPPVHANKNGHAPPSTATAASNTINGGGSNGLSVFTRSRSVTTRPVVPEVVAAPATVQTSTSSSTTPRLKVGDLAAADSPRKRRFWSFLHLQPSRPFTSCSNNPQTAAADGDAAPCPPLPPKNHQSQPPPPAAVPVIISSGITSKPPSIHPDPIPAAGTTKPPSAAPATATWNNDDADQALAGDASPSESQASATSASPFGRKVERSRSVGCGSRTFSGDFLERISTGLGDCALRRVESHREPAGKLGNKIVLHRLSISTATAVDDDDEDDNCDCRRRRSARCRGIFGGMIPSSFYTSSSAAASSYWPPPQDEVGSKSGAGGSNSNSNRGTPRAKGGWGWAFASPIRAFRTNSSVRGNANSSSHSHKYPAFHGPEADAGRRSMSVAGGVGFGAGVRAPSYPYMNGG